MFAQLPQKKASVVNALQHQPAKGNSIGAPTQKQSAQATNVSPTTTNVTVASPHQPIRGGQMTMDAFVKKTASTTNDVLLNATSPIQPVASPVIESVSHSPVVPSTHQISSFIDPSSSSSMSVEITSVIAPTTEAEFIPAASHTELIDHASTDQPMAIDLTPAAASVSIPESSYISPPASPKRSHAVQSGHGSPTPSTYSTPPRVRERGHHARSATMTSGMMPPPASPHRSPIVSLFGSGGKHRRHGSGSLSSSPLDPRYAARLAPSGSGTNSPKWSPQQSPGGGGALASSPRHKGDMTLSPFQTEHGALQPRRLQLMYDNLSAAPSPKHSPAHKSSRHESPRHPSLHIPPSPGRRAAAGEDIALPFSTPASAMSPAVLSSLVLSTPSASFSGPLNETPSLRALQESSAPYDFSDRFIPSRAGSNLSHGYFQEDSEAAGMQENLNAASHGGAAAANANTQPFSPAYGLLLRSEILGSKDGAVSSSTLTSTSIGTPHRAAADHTREPYNAALVIHRHGSNPIVGSSTLPPGATPGSGDAAASATPNTPGASASSSTTASFHSPSSTRSEGRKPSHFASFPPTYRFKSPRHGLLNNTYDPFAGAASSVVGKETQKLLANIAPSQRVISKMPFKVLDAPGLKDDFYLNLVDWSCQNVVAVALGSCVYLWSGATTKVAKLFDLGSQEDSVTSVSWTLRGNHLAVGTKLGKIQLWDVVKQKCVLSLDGHTGRVGSLAWNSHLLASGSRDRSILLHDPRASSKSTSQVLQAHQQEVCGMKWSYDEHQLASGGNDNKLFIWSANQLKPIYKFSEHTAAVKAIAWSPHQHGLLVSGGGTADRCIRFWSTVTGQSVAHLDTGSQVCNLIWSKNVNEIVSTHGYALNQIIAWKYPTMQQVTTLVGHSMRVLYLAVSPCGQTILTGAGDETLRFWNLFGPNLSESKGSVGSQSAFVLPTAADHLIR